MTYLLDTTAFSDLMREEVHTVARLGAVSDGDEVLTCPIVRGEILFGLSRMPLGKRRASFEAKAAEMFETILCCAVPPAAGDHYASVRLACQGAGSAIDANDTWIAATALALGARVVSRDSDFLRVPDLEVEDWSRDLQASAAVPSVLHAGQRDAFDEGALGEEEEQDDR